MSELCQQSGTTGRAGRAEAGRVRRAHLDPVRIPPVRLGADQGRHIDTVDRQVPDLAVDVPR
jgi:hypothetical protein